MRKQVANFEAALALAEKMKASGRANWFRGQSRPWPLRSSFVRKGAAEQAVAIERWKGFWGWLQTVPALVKIAADEDAALAVAQHYGLATNLVDFTIEPKVAAFFAAHAPPKLGKDEDLSCIICFNYDEFADVCASIKSARPDMLEPHAVRVDIPELWRIQAQCGIFLEYPYDESFEQHAFDFDYIVFPTERNPAVLAKLIPFEDIYPSQKSDLEILLDQYFMRERMAQGAQIINEIAKSDQIIIHQYELAHSGVSAEYFKPAGLPVHDSWSTAESSGWRSPKLENWSAISKSPTVEIRYQDMNDCHKKIQFLYRQFLDKLEIEKIINGPITWIVHGAPIEKRPISRSLQLVWDGLRRWPYTPNEIAMALATTVAYHSLIVRNPAARVEPQTAQMLARECLGEVLEIEIGIEDGSYTRGYANKNLLQNAVREDFSTFLSDPWRVKISDIYQILQIAINLKQVFVFERFKTVFCTQIVPTQTVLRDEQSGKARLYNPARAKILGLP